MRLRPAVATGITTGALLALPVGAARGQYDYDVPSPPPPQSGSQPSGGATTNVKAEGNPFTGGLRFNPAEVTVKVGQVVKWTNTDSAVPHTATEDHGLWNLAGDYGADPFPRGIAPGESVERPFEAGTHQYYCQVHSTPDGTALNGTVFVPVELNVSKVKVKRKRGRKRGRGRKRRRSRTYLVVRAKWAAGAPAEGLVFDVQRRVRGGELKDFKAGTTQTNGSFRAGRKGTTWEVQARLRSATDPSKATDWSPLASIKAR